MNGLKIVNLSDVLGKPGEEKVFSILSGFSCPPNQDVETFLREKAVLFAQNSFSQTHLIFSPYKGESVLVAYFTLANKYMIVKNDAIRSNSMRRRLGRFASYDKELRQFVIPAPLIAQVGKNYRNGYNNLISGDHLIELACEAVRHVQLIVGG